MGDVTRAAKNGPALCGTPYHPINTCLECKRLYMRQHRAEHPKKRDVGFKGPECYECGGIRSRVNDTGYTDDAQRIRERVCLDCGNKAVSVEVYVEDVTFWQVCASERRTRKRELDYQTRGKGLYRTPVKYRGPDRFDVNVRVIRAKKVA
jgi:hypothetical protein